AEFCFLPGALTALQTLATLDWPIVVVTNQSAIGRGFVTQAAVEQIHQRMIDAIHAAGGRIDAIFYCPHHPEDSCDCRKPRPGLLHQAQARLQIDLTRSILIGDAVSDLQAAQVVGCFPILVKSGRGWAQLDQWPREKMDEIGVAEDLADAVPQILRYAQAKSISVTIP
ncbi:MAG: HAD-IIIA family hydrolase, partial [Caldilineaceae bacterium]|nr:HAD-IIIA family hydrolase [Caldilineaceae bacterium]